ncbi:MAG: hypothetical protein ACEQSK_08865 [Sphingomonadaceae bacterium]
MDHIAKRPISLPISDLLELELHLMAMRPGLKLEDFITELLNHWLQVQKERLALRQDGQPMHGIQWKNLFLPAGTRLRTSYQATTEFAKVVGNRILSDEEVPMTPSQFANRHAKGRNAWRFIWLRFPGEENWVRADDCRANSVSPPKPSFPRRREPIDLTFRGKA